MSTFSHTESAAKNLINRFSIDVLVVQDVICIILTNTSKTQRSGASLSKKKPLTGALFTIRIDGEWDIQSENGIRNKALVDLY